MPSASRAYGTALESGLLAPNPRHGAALPAPADARFNNEQKQSVIGARSALFAGLSEVARGLELYRL